MFLIIVNIKFNKRLHLFYDKEKYEKCVVYYCCVHNIVLYKIQYIFENRIGLSAKWSFRDKGTI